MNIVGRASYGRSPYWQDRDGRWTDRGCGRPPKPATYPTPTEPGWYRAVYKGDKRSTIVQVFYDTEQSRLSVWTLGSEDAEALESFFWGPRIPEWRPE